MTTLFKYLVVSVLFFTYSVSAEYKLTKVVSGLGIPWGMAFLSDEKLLIAQKDGTFSLANLKTNSLQKVKNTPDIYQIGQGGLLDVRLSPNFQEDGWIYFTHVQNSAKGAVTVLSRTKLSNDSFKNTQELLVTKSGGDGGRHFGSRITFDEEGYLYFGVGDRGHRPNGQDISNHASTIIRLHLDGSVPKDNPFVGKDGLDEIYSYGHRNPQGLYYDKQRGILFENEHGPRGGDEINIIEKGENYGWATVSHGKEYWNFMDVGEAKSKEGMKDPIKVYIPSIAPGSLLVYSGKVFKQWEGDLFSGALALTHLNKVSLDGELKPIDEERFFEDMGERIRNVVESPDGLIYFSTDSGDIYRISP